MANTPKPLTKKQQEEAEKQRQNAAAARGPKNDIEIRNVEEYVGEANLIGFGDKQLKKPLKTEKPVVLSNNKRREFEKRIKGLKLNETKPTPKPVEKIGQPKKTGEDRYKKTKHVTKGGKKVPKEVNQKVHIYTQTLAGSEWQVAVNEHSDDGYLLYNFRQGTPNFKKRGEILREFPDADLSEAGKIDPKTIADLITEVLRGKVTDPKVIINRIDSPVKNKLDRLHKELREERDRKAQMDATKRARRKQEEQEKLLSAFNTPLEVNETDLDITHFENKYTAAFLNTLFRKEIKDQEGNVTGYEIDHFLFSDVVSAIYDTLGSELKAAMIVEDETIKGIKLRVFQGNDGSYPSAEIGMLTTVLGRLASLHGSGQINFFNKFKNKEGVFDKNAFLKFVGEQALPVAKQFKGAVTNIIKEDQASSHTYYERFSHIGTFPLQRTIETLFSDGRNRQLLENFSDIFGDEVKVRIDDKNPNDKAFIATLPLVNGQANPRLRDIISGVLMTIGKTQMESLTRGKSIKLNDDSIRQIIHSVEQAYDSGSPTVHPKILGLDFHEASDKEAMKNALIQEAAMRDIEGTAHALPTTSGRQRQITVVKARDSEGNPVTERVPLHIPQITSDGTLELKYHPDPDKQVMIPTKGHRKFLNLSEQGDMILIDGPAGSGKTFWKCYRAAEMFAKGYVEQIVVSAPAVDVGSSIGFLPGTDYEKMYPYVQQILQKFDEIFGHGNKAEGKKVREALVEMGLLVVMPSNVLRGYDADGVAGVFDEAQNWSWIELKTIATRLGKGGSKFFFGGHDGQCDKPTRKDEWKIFRERLDNQKLRDMGLFVMQMEAQDVMRHKLVRELQEGDYLDDPYGDDRDAEGKPNPVVALSSLAKNLGMTLDDLVAGMTKAYEQRQQKTGQDDKPAARITSGPSNPSKGPGG